VSTSPARLDDFQKRLAPAEVEAVLGRAIELHVREWAAGSHDRLSADDVLRIGRELGLSDTLVRHALAELDGGVTPERTRLARYLGDRRAGASRVVEHPAPSLQDALDGYLRGPECMVVERRQQARTTYVPAEGLLASANRAVRRLGGSHALLRADRIETAVRPLDGTSAAVAVTVDLHRKRRGYLALGLLGGTAGGTVAAALAASLVAPPLAIVGLPVAAAGLVATRLAYRGAAVETAERVESLLDRLEHGELRGPSARVRLLRL
jgi:hypothetical protein